MVPWKTLRYSFQSQLWSNSGTLLTAELALQYGLACNTAGGTHHAFPAHGSGYCILNDMAVAAEVLLARKAVDRILILDLDVHQVRFDFWKMTSLAATTDFFLDMSKHEVLEMIAPCIVAIDGICWFAHEKTVADWLIFSQLS